MPHCIIEYSKDLVEQISVEKLQRTVFDSCFASDLFEAQDIKVRSREFEDFIIAKNKNNFIHLTVKILAGRSENQRLELSSLQFKALESLMLPLTQLSVDIVELDKNCYFKN